MAVDEAPGPGFAQTSVPGVVSVPSSTGEQYVYVNGAPGDLSVHVTDPAGQSVPVTTTSTNADNGGGTPSEFAGAWNKFAAFDVNRRGSTGSRRPAALR